MQEKWPSVKLGEILSTRKEEPDLKSILNGDIPVVGKIAFNSGRIELREDNKTKTKMILIKPGDIVISGINAVKGAIAIFGKENKKPAAATIHYSAFKVNEKKADSAYLWYLLRSSSFNKLLFSKLRKGIKTEIKPKRFLSIKVLLPPLVEQKNMVLLLKDVLTKMSRAIAYRRNAFEESQNAFRAILERISRAAKRENWKFVEIADIALINPEQRNPSKENPDEFFQYIDISSVENGSGRITQPKKILGKKAPSRARRVIHTNDVIMSTVRPYLKSFAVVPPEFDNQICSTGFAVLSCKSNILPEYLLNILFSDSVINQCRKLMVGAHYPALRISYVSRIKIPLPSLKEQKRIVKYLKKVRVRFEDMMAFQHDTQNALKNLNSIVTNKIINGEFSKPNSISQ